MSRVFGRSDQQPALDVAEDRQGARDRDGRAVGERLLPAGDPVEDELADVRVLADDDEDGRRAGAVRLPRLVRLLVVAIEAPQGALELLRELGLALDRRPSRGPSSGGRRGSRIHRSR